jgi:hypothetical protein
MGDRNLDGEHGEASNNREWLTEIWRRIMERD